MAATHSYTNLVFEGGGVKVVAYCGALEVLEQAGVLGQLTAVAGTSAGAITATLVALGYSPAELRETMLDLNFRRFEDGVLEGPIRLVEHYGWYRGTAFKKWMAKQIGAKLGSQQATFADLAAVGRPDLRVVATDVATQQPEIFSLASSPDVAVADAVRMSMSIPFFFAAIERDGSVYVDGGVTWNYPVEIFDGEQANPQTLGLHLDWTGHPPPPATDVHDLVVFAKVVYESVLAMQVDFFQRSRADLERTVIIDDLGILATDFDITREQKLELIARGAAATRTFLDARTPAPAAPAEPLSD
jgi:NTE family protein